MSSFSMLWPFRKGAPKGTKSSKSKDENSEEEEAHLEEFGVTRDLLDYVDGFTINAFKDYHLLDDWDAASATSAGKDLTDWRERHAILVLSRAKELSQLRYLLCPRHLKEKQFWRIYFLLVRSYVSLYEIRAIQKAKHRMMELENDKSVGKTAVEVEMTDTKHASGSSCIVQCNSEPLVDGEL